jgi:tRNA(fMet)-specific endonuclease VapC
MKYILDSNILLYMIRGHEQIDLELRKLGAYDRNASSVSVVTIGEVLSISIQNNWGQSKKNLLENFIQTIKPFPVLKRDILDIYAEIDAYSKSRINSKPLPKGQTARKMGKNDLWIAATTHLAQATLITTDADFDHLNGLYFPIIKLSSQV